MSWWGSKYQLAKRKVNNIMETREQIERIVRENVSWQELTTFPELTDNIVDEIEHLMNVKVLEKAAHIVQQLQVQVSYEETK